MKRLLPCFCLLSLFLFASCATKPVDATPGFWQQQGATVAVIVGEMPKEGHYVTIGTQLFDYAIPGAEILGMEAAMKRADPTPFGEAAGVFEAGLTKAGFKPVVTKGRINLPGLPRFDRISSSEFECDLSRLVKTSGARYALVLELIDYGGLRTYSHYEPTSVPHGFAAVRGRLVDLTNHNAVLWDTGTKYPKNTVEEPMVGEWKQPPDYPNLVASGNRAVVRAPQFLFDSFLATKP